MYSLTDQIRRSSRSVGAIVAEAWPRRRYKAAFVEKLSQALAEATETQSWLDHALRCRYVDISQHELHNQRWQTIGGKLSRMMEKSASFWTPKPET